MLQITKRYHDILNLCDIKLDKTNLSKIHTITLLF
jgi:hypothetical protein